jgi:hypothetical protein
MKRRQSLLYLFKEEAEKLLTPDPKAPFRIHEDQYPDILIKLIGKEISIETVVILDHFIGFIEKFDAKYGRQDFLWGKWSLKLRKYKPFLQFDKDKCKSILEEILNNT